MQATKEVSLFDSSTSDEDENEVFILRRRVAELEALLRESEIRCESLERELDTMRGDDGVVLRVHRQRRKIEEEPAFEIDDRDLEPFSTVSKPVRRQAGRLRSLAQERRAVAKAKHEPPPPPAPPEESEEAVRAREDARVKAWAARKADIVAMLNSLDEILPPASSSINLSAEEQAEPRTVRRAYFQAVRRVHPDKSRNLSLSLRCRAQCVFSALTDALDAYDGLR